jgi:hypothetical protein
MRMLVQSSRLFRLIATTRILEQKSSTTEKCSEEIIVIVKGKILETVVILSHLSLHYVFIVISDMLMVLFSTSSSLPMCSNIADYVRCDH